ncbi:MAG TPA: DUF4232 domain-containing protein [Trebonia sp.]
MRVIDGDNGLVVAEGDMMTSSRILWRVAAISAFAATATLAVILSRTGLIDTSLTSVHAGSSAATTSATTQNIPARGSPKARPVTPVPGCEASRLRITVHGPEGPDEQAVMATISIEFANGSAATCALRGYPGVAAYSAGGAPVGNPASHDSSAGAQPDAQSGAQSDARLVVLAPGASAHATVLVGVAASPRRQCHPVTAAGLRIAPPDGPATGQAERYVSHPLSACSAAGRNAPVFLRVRAVQPG